jgi:NAD(P)-dependent dehydrogenase (short-subunit alcohol dehydrogenase family)
MSGQPPLALITGGLHRIGAAMAIRLADAGYALALHSRSGGTPDAALSAALEKNGTDWAECSADLSQPGAACTLFDTIVARFGRAPTLLINNASMFGAGAMAQADEASLHTHLATNLVAPTLLAQAVAQAARAANHPCIILNILDQRVRNPVADQFAYTLSKQALSEGTRTMAIALAPHARVNAIAPGLTLPTDEYAPGQMERIAQLMPLGRLPTPDDIADAALYLIGARAVTGQTIFVDGGANLKSFDRDFIDL